MQIEPMKSRCIVNLQIRIEHRKAGGARREWPVQDAMSRTDKDYEPQMLGQGAPTRRRETHGRPPVAAVLSKMSMILFGKFILIGNPPTSTIRARLVANAGRETVKRFQTDSHVYGGVSQEHAYASSLQGCFPSQTLFHVNWQ
jgi:hypothetical protein